MQQTAKVMDKAIMKQVRMNYLVYLPKDFDPASEQKWPLIYFLHGMGQRGDDIQIIKKHGIPNDLEAGAELPFIVVCPQCSAHSFWPMEIEALLALLDEITETYPVDMDRIYLTGLSMGGYGSWALGLSAPERFAAIAPICGGGVPGIHVEALKNVPVWAFHGDQDDVVPIQESEKMVRALEACGGNVKFTVYPGVKHDSWSETYRNPELYAWFLEHSLNSRK